MTYISNKDYLIEVQRGNVPGASMVHKFGYNDAVPNGSWAHISLIPFAIANFRTTAATMRVKAGGNAADTAAGAGAREITIQGIDSNFAEVSEAVATAGAAASSATTASFWRVHRAWVSSAGAYTGANTANVVIEDSGGAADMLQIDAGVGQSQYAGWSVPTGKTAYLLSADITVDGNKRANIRCFTRAAYDTVAAPFQAKRLKRYWAGVIGSLHYDPMGPAITIPEKSDFWFEGYGDGAVSSISVDFELLVIDD